MSNMDRVLGCIYEAIRNGGVELRINTNDSLGWYFLRESVYIDKLCWLGYDVSSYGYTVTINLFKDMPYQPILRTWDTEVIK